MTLDNLINKFNDENRKLIDKFDHLYYASLAFLTIKGLDIISTSLLAKRYGIDGERNEVIKYAMEQFGIDAGLVIHTIPVIAVILGADIF